MFATACFAIGLLSGEARALDPTKAITQYVHDAWQAPEGLPQDWVRSIAQTRDGYIWFATEEGLARFDGVRFTVFDRSNTNALRSNIIRALLAGRDGSLWIGTRNGFSRLRNGEIESVVPEETEEGPVEEFPEEETGGVGAGE